MELAEWGPGGAGAEIGFGGLGGLPTYCVSYYGN